MYAASAGTHWYFLLLGPRISIGLKSQELKKGNYTVKEITHKLFDLQTAPI